ncbi:MAG: hypothetical protein EOO38_03245 [Cytophagaceae bacterium]|nr:MAG: hypothetical protein EOO38_03245 [Cytophagaceae bacterium]
MSDIAYLNERACPLVTITDHLIVAESEIYATSENQDMRDGKNQEFGDSRSQKFSYRCFIGEGFTALTTWTTAKIVMGLPNIEF